MGQFRRGITSEGEIFATSLNPEACCYSLVGLWMVPLVSWGALSKSWATRHSNASQSHNHRTLGTNTSLSLPSARYAAAHRASEGAGKLLVTRRKHFAVGKFSPLF